ncbi:MULTISPECIES: hypothetical protein [Streptomyces]|uniref:hypothetical protein n=1 Tax=Streptomyces TaxID=1883 RepID=UPI00163BA421|nr:MULTISPECIES: hypothetical protein [Streptomyces]MBC2876287.1 hypothetical protein [Streptomyces sp. TYQ1024]UBI40935.1 hypothetical protein K7I03_02760 [Streptomyces mobaraensis]UKW33420.1 hypothetical protein MCU78_02790 [Streptomyces sp. TYQ1024]
MIRVLERFRRHLRPAGQDGGAPPPRPPERQHNLFEAAAVYVAACAENDPDRSAEAARWVSPEALSFGVNELACRALVALARERGTSPQHVARSLLGLPAA